MGQVKAGWVPGMMNRRLVSTGMNHAVEAGARLPSGVDVGPVSGGLPAQDRLGTSSSMNARGGVGRRGEAHHEHPECEGARDLGRGHERSRHSGSSGGAGFGRRARHRRQPFPQITDSGTGLQRMLRGRGAERIAITSL